MRGRNVGNFKKVNAWDPIPALEAVLNNALAEWLVSAAVATEFQYKRKILKGI